MLYMCDSVGAMFALINRLSGIDKHTDISLICLHEGQ